MASGYHICSCGEEVGLPTFPADRHQVMVHTDNVMIFTIQCPNCGTYLSFDLSYAIIEVLEEKA